MSTKPLQGKLRQTLLHMQAVTLTDGDLLTRFVADADQRAFVELVRRHGAMVLRVCQRVLGHTQDAEDAFQATLVVLVRKASMLKQGELGGWLHNVAYRVAQKARSQALRRRVGTLPAADLVSSPASDPDVAQDVRGILDEELLHLPGKYRLPLVLCYLEGKTVTEAADQLGWNRATFGTRLLRGRERLRVRLAHRGVTLSAAGLTATFAEAASGATPAALAASALRSCSGAAPVAEPVLTLAQGFIADSARRRGVLVALLAALLLVGGSTWWLASRSAAPVMADASKARLVLQHPNQVFRIAFTPDGKELVSAGFASFVHRWDTRTGQELPNRLQESAFSLAVSADGRTLAAGGWFGTVRLWDAASGRELVTVLDADLVAGQEHLKTRGGEQPTPDQAVLGSVAVQFSPDNRLLAVGHERDARIRLYHLPRLRDRRPDGQRVSMQGSHTFTSQWMHSLTFSYAIDAIAIRPDRTLTNAENVRDVAFSPDGQTLIARGSRLVAWDVATGNKKATLVTAASTGAAPLFSPDGRLIAASSGSQVCLWDAVTFRDRGVIETGQGWLFAVAFSPDSKLLATAGMDGRVRLWNADSGKLLAILQHGMDRMSSLAFAPHGRTLASAGFDRTVKFWELADILPGK